MGVVVASLAAAGAAMTVACAGLLSIEELPLRGMGDGAALSDAGPATDACTVAPDASFCATLCPRADFCDDFEGEGDDLSRWNGGGLGAGGAANRLVDSPENTLGIVDDERNSSRVLQSTVIARDTGTALAFVAHELHSPEGQLPRGVRVRVQFRVMDLNFKDVDAAREEKFLYAIGFGDGARGEGIGLILVEGKKHGDYEVTLQQRTVVSGAKKVELTSLLDLDQATLKNNWLGLEFILAPSSVLDAMAQSCALVDANGDPLDAASLALPGDALRLVVRVGPVSRCVAARDEFASGDWLRSVQVLSGAAVGGPATASVRTDNLAVSLLY
ncbi:MAG: hypothetical protein IPG50_35450 [Myxococcales bacterium]|nr:hypothetical protein [Myxococcales bacterium]